MRKSSKGEVFCLLRPIAGIGVFDRSGTISGRPLEASLIVRKGLEESFAQERMDGIVPAWMERLNIAQRQSLPSGGLVAWTAWCGGAGVPAEASSKVTVTCRVLGEDGRILHPPHEAEMGEDGPSVEVVDVALLDAGEGHGISVVKTQLKRCPLSSRSCCRRVSLLARR